LPPPSAARRNRAVSRTRWYGRSKADLQYQLFAC